MSYFSNALIQLRKQDGLTQSELAAAIGMSKSIISMYESGQRMPSFEAAEALADFFNVNMDQLYGRDDREEQNEPAALDFSDLDVLAEALSRLSNEQLLDVINKATARRAENAAERS